MARFFMVRPNSERQGNNRAMELCYEMSYSAAVGMQRRLLILAWEIDTSGS